jgi:hypothetical protein
LVLLLLRASACGSGASSSPDGGGGAGGAKGAAGMAGSAAGATAGHDGGAGMDAGGGAAGTMPKRPCNHEIDNPSCWASKEVTGYTENQQSFSGAIFDGKAIVFVNESTGSTDHQLRFDLTGDFTTTGWSAFDTNLLGSGFRGGVFDGRYVYLTTTMPSNNGAGGLNYDAIFVRQDTQTGFTAWEAFNLTKASGTPDLTVPGFQGAAFDGRYVYFAPNYVGGAAGSMLSGQVTRFDTQATFKTAASWSRFDTTTVDPDAHGFSGVTFAGRYLYFAPRSSTNAHAARYDTQADFKTAGSWATFETTSLGQYAGGFNGALFDGRYVYFVPSFAQRDIYRCVVTRYDTQADFKTAGSWATFDTHPLDNGDPWDFEGAAFDGRYVYFVPEQGYNLLRYDTQGAFTDATSWTAQDLLAVGDHVGSYSGAAFDGRYLYLAPNGFDSVLRFDARTPPAVPASYKGGSWY